MEAPLSTVGAVEIEVGAGVPAESGLPAGMVAVRLADLCWSGRVPGDGSGLDGALVVAPGAGGRPLAAGELAVFCQVVAVAPVVRRKDGRVQAGGHLAHHVRLGLMEDQLPPGCIEALVARLGLAEERLRALSAAMVVRCVLLMVLLPGADHREVVARAAGALVRVPWARPFHVPGREVLPRHRARLGEQLFAELFWAAAAAAAAEPVHTTAPAGGGYGWLGGLLVCACDGVLTRCADTAENRAEFGCPGGAEEGGPFPQPRAVVVTACVSRAVLGAEVGDSGTGEQTLLRRLVEKCPWVFAGRIIIFDRNFLGVDLVRALLEAGAHVLLRIKAGIELPNLGWLPDGSYRTVLGGEGGIPMRVVEFDVTPPEGATGSGELFCLATDLTDHEAFPAADLSGLYRLRWSGSETTFKEDKSTIDGAGPSTGAILRSTTPKTTNQELWAWLTGTNLTRAAARAATAPGRPATPARPARRVAARAVSFTAATREVLRSVAHSLHTATTSPAARAAATAHAGDALLAQRVQVDRDRHCPRKTKGRQKFPHTTGETTVTGACTVTLCVPGPPPGTG